MKKILVSSAIILATSLVACTKSSVAPTDPSADIALAERHSPDDPAGQHPTTGIPPAVVASFTSRYPTATRAVYQQEMEHGTTIYKVKFFQKATRWIAFFQPDGTFISARKK